MKIEYGEMCGFCNGVEYTVNTAIKTIENSEDKIYCLGDIVHNERVISELENKGMITVNKIEDVPENSKVIFRAHGESIDIHNKAIEKNINIVDLTCGRIRAIRKKIEKEKNNAYIIIIGKKNHPETIANQSYAGNDCSIVEEMEDIKVAYKNINKYNKKRIYVIAQTTFSSVKFDRLVEEIKNTIIEREVVIDKTICDATEKRQKETFNLSKRVDKIIVIGGKKSSNTVELVKIAEKGCKEVYHIQTLKELKSIVFSANDKIGIVAGASTPKNSIIEVGQYLEKYFVEKEG